MPSRHRERCGNVESESQGLGHADRVGGGGVVGWEPADPEAGADSLSLVGRVFFSCVSVFFSLALSKLLISPKSGLSAIFLKQS